MNARVLLLALLPVALAFPAMAQDVSVTATLRILGDVMVSSDGEFTTASDGQPIVAGQRIMVGDNASATVNYGQDCKRSYESAGVYTIEPARCDKRNRKDDQSSQGHPTVTTAAITLGAAVVAAAAIQSGEESPPDRPISR
jgi:hypothetical protein